jgi:hypothetical protein
MANWKLVSTKQDLGVRVVAGDEIIWLDNISDIPCSMFYSRMTLKRVNSDDVCFWEVNMKGVM